MTSALKRIGNVIWWFPCFGFIPALSTIFFGAMICCTIVLAPFGFGIIEIGKFYLAPYTRSLIYEDRLRRSKPSIIWRIISTILFIIYLPFGILSCIVLSINIFMSCFTIIGIPLVIPAVKAFHAYFNPIGIICVSDVVKEALDRRDARKKLKYLMASTTSSSSSTSSSSTPTPFDYNSYYHHHDKNRKKHHHHHHHYF